MSQSNNSIREKEIFKDLIKRIAAKGGSLESQSTPDIQVHPEINKGVKLKQFPNEVACLPNEWIRSGLFSASNKIHYEMDPLTKTKERVFYHRKAISCHSENVRLHYTGYYLNQFDLRVYLASIREAKTQYLQRFISLSPYEFCEAARIPRCGKNKEAIYNSLVRLSEGKLHSELYAPGPNGYQKRLRFYHDNLIYKFKDDPVTGKWELSLSEELASMYLFQTSWIDWDIWNSLKGEVTKALMLQICSHVAHPENPQKLSHEKIKMLLQIESPLKMVKRLVISSGSQFLERRVVDSWVNDGGILTFTRPRKA